jgi:hypothetical protein
MPARHASALASRLATTAAVGALAIGVVAGIPASVLPGSGGGQRGVDVAGAQWNGVAPDGAQWNGVDPAGAQWNGTVLAGAQWNAASPAGAQWN